MPMPDGGGREAVPKDPPRSGEDRFNRLPVPKRHKKGRPAAAPSCVIRCPKDQKAKPTPTTKLSKSPKLLMNW